jgi:hypothetical protein
MMTAIRLQAEPNRRLVRRGVGSQQQFAVEVGERDAEGLQPGDDGGVVVQYVMVRLHLQVPESAQYTS